MHPLRQFLNKGVLRPPGMYLGVTPTPFSQPVKRIASIIQVGIRKRPGRGFLGTAGRRRPSQKQGNQNTRNNTHLGFHKRRIRVITGTREKDHV